MARLLRRGERPRTDGRQAAGPIEAEGPGKGGVGQANHEAVGREGHESPDVGTDPFDDVRAE